MDGLEKLHEIRNELGAQRERLDKRSQAIEAQVAGAPDGEKAALAVAAEAFREVVETGIEFQHALVETMIGIVEEGMGDGELIGIEPEHADVIMRPLASFAELLTVLITNGSYAGEDLERLKRQQKECAKAQELVESLVLPPEDGEGAEDDEEEEAPESGES